MAFKDCPINSCTAISPVKLRRLLEKASAAQGTYFLLHGYPITSTCSPASLETVSRMSDLFVERMAKSKAQEEDGSSENGKLDTGEFEKPELLSSHTRWR